MNYVDLALYKINIIRIIRIIIIIIIIINNIADGRKTGRCGQRWWQRSTHEVYKTQGEKEKINIARIVTVHDYCSVFTSIRFN